MGKNVMLCINVEGRGIVKGKKGSENYGRKNIKTRGKKISVNYEGKKAEEKKGNYHCIWKKI